MSQYLSHIAALTLNRIEPVLPRLNSRFEAPLEFEPPAELGFVHQSVDLKPRFEDKPKQKSIDRPVEPVDKPFNKTAKTQEQAVEIKDIQLNDPESDEQKTALDRKLYPLAMESTQSIEQPLIQAPQEIQKDTPPKQQTIVERVESRLTEHTHSERVIREMESYQSNQVIIRTEEAMQPVTIKPANIALSAEPSKFEQTKAHRQAVESTVQSSVEAMQTVHVSIGRIEIRAHQADKPKEKPRTASKTMSLDDYLKQRGRA